MESAGLRAVSVWGGHALQKKQTETEHLVQYANTSERSPAGRRRFGVIPSALGWERLHFLDLGGGGGCADGALHLQTDAMATWSDSRLLSSHFPVVSAHEVLQERLWCVCSREREEQTLKADRLTLLRLVCTTVLAVR